MSSEEKPHHLPDIVELNLKSETIDQLFFEVGNLIAKSPKILDPNAALREFQNLQRFWTKKGNELIKKEEKFFSNGVFPLCINYCSFLDKSGPLMFLGRSLNGIDLRIEKFPPSKIVCIVLFQSVESYEHLNKQNTEKQKINIYWNNFLKNQYLLNKFMALKNVEDLQKMTEEISGLGEKRKHPRFKSSAPVYCSLLGESWGRDQKEEAKILDISLSGFLIEHLTPYYLNSALEMEPLLEDNKLYLWGKVCHIKRYQAEKGEKFASGVSITNISEPDKNSLTKYLSKLTPTS